MSTVIQYEFRYFVGKSLYKLFSQVVAMCSGLVRKSFQSSNGNVCYYISNKPDRINILFLHGFSGNKNLWLNTVFFLRKSYNVIIPDLLGHGLSCKSTNRNYSINTYATAVSELLASLGITEFSIVGSSMGCSVAAMLSTESRFTIHASIYLNPFGVTQLQINALQHFRYNTTDPFVVNSIVEYNEFLRSITQSILKIPTWVKYYLAVEHMKQSGHISDMFGWLINSDPFSDVMKKKRFPLIILAGQSDTVIDINCYYELASNLQDCRLHWLENIGHLPMLEAPKLVAIAIQRWLTFGSMNKHLQINGNKR